MGFSIALIVFSALLMLLVLMHMGVAVGPLFGGGGRPHHPWSAAPSVAERSSGVDWGLGGPACSPPVRRILAPC